MIRAFSGLVRTPAAVATKSRRKFRRAPGPRQSVDNYKQISQRVGIYDGIMNQPLRSFLADLYRIAVEAAHPASCLPQLLPPPPSGRLIVVAAGKAAGSMTEVAEAHYLDKLQIATERLSGVAVSRHGYGRPLRRVRMIEAGHPIPDAAGLEGADRALKLADDAGKNDLVLVLMSGGASANLDRAGARHFTSRTSRR